MSDSESEKLSVSRRSFFRKMLLRGMDEAEQAGKRVVNRVTGVIGDLNTAPTSDSIASAPPTQFLRPPGALPEPDFAETCSRCAHCVEACPADCINMEEGIAGGLPHIIPRQRACVVCDDLSCMKSCPSGALQLVAAATLIEMGAASVNFDQCLRSAKDSADPECRVCVDRCPIGETALAVGADNHIEVRRGCIGCGVCEEVCPTPSTSIVVERNSNDEIRMTSQ